MADMSIRSDEELSEEGTKNGIALGVLLTLVSWFICRMVVSIPWGPARDPLGWTPSMWSRWDSANYYSIAIHGRIFARCSQLPQIPNPFHATYCGTAMWLPGYPWLIRILGGLGIPLQSGGIILAWTATAGALFLVWYGWARSLSHAKAVMLMVLLGLFPGSIYNFSYFPTSLALVSILGALIAVSREKYLLGALLMACAGICYPSAWFAAFGMAIGLVFVAIPQGDVAVFRHLGYAALCFLSIIVLFVDDQLSFGRIGAYFIQNTQPGLQARGFPGQDFLRLIFTRRTAEQLQIGAVGGVVLAVQGALAVGLSAWSGAVAFAGVRRGDRDPAVLFPALVSLGVVAGVLVLSANGGAWNRSVVLAAPCVLCLRKYPTPVIAVVLVVVACTTAAMSRWFFVGSLV